MKTLERIVSGLGGAGKSVHKDIYKAALKLLVDSNMAVRCSASKVGAARRVVHGFYSIGQKTLFNLPLSKSYDLHIIFLPNV